MSIDHGHMMFERGEKSGVHGDLLNPNLRNGGAFTEMLFSESASSLQSGSQGQSSESYRIQVESLDSESAATLVPRPGTTATVGLSG